MKCARCQTTMTTDRVDGAKVFRCSSCESLLIAKESLLVACSRQDRSSDELLSAWRRARPIDTAEFIRCPTCRWKMERMVISQEKNIPQDYCSQCDLVWCDPGELEMHQLAWRSTEKGKEAARFKKIHQEMTDEEKEILQNRINELPTWQESREDPRGVKTRGFKYIEKLWADYFSQ